MRLRDGAGGTLTIDICGVAVVQGLLLIWVLHRVRTEPTAVSEGTRIGGWDAVTSLSGILLVLCCLWGGAELVENIGRQDRLVRLDTALSTWIDGVRWPVLVRTAEWISLGTGPYGSSAFALATVALLLWAPRWRTAACFLVAGAGTAVSTTVLKGLLGRERPAGVDIYHPHGSAFPSGHTSGTAFVAFFVAWLVTRHRGPVQRSSAFAVAALVTAVVGASRMYLAVHWMSDILGGATLGLAWAVAAVLAARWLGSSHRARGRSSP